MPPTLTTSARIRAVAQAMTEPERRHRFYEIARIAADNGGILLDSDLTTELVVLGSLLGIYVEWERVELPVFSKQASEAQKAEPKGSSKAKGAKQWDRKAQAPARTPAAPAAQASIFDGT